MTHRVLAMLALAAAVLAGAPAWAQPSQSYTPGSFDRLVIAGVAHVELSQSDKDVVTVVGDADVQRAVGLHLSRSGELRVSTEGEWKFWNREPIVLRVQMKEIHQLSISGAGDIVANRPIRTDDLRVSISGRGDVRLPDLTADSLRFDISGAGEATLGGAVEDLTLRVSGAGKVDAEKLRASNASVQISGAGNTELWVTDQFKVVVSGVGTVNYWGKPDVRQTVSSFGSLVARGEKK
jgi:hypothetical protein